MLRQTEFKLPFGIPVLVYHLLCYVVLIMLTTNRWSSAIMLFLCWLWQIVGFFACFTVMKRPDYHQVRAKYKKNTLLYEENGVTILKPLHGVPKRLSVNLEEYFRLNYPKYELIFCIQEKEGQDELLALIDALVKKYPDVDATVSVGFTDWGINPKVCNMGTGYNAAKYELVWIADANIVCSDCVIQDMVEKFSADDKVGLVHQVPWMISGPGKTPHDPYSMEGYISGGSVLDRWYFATGHARGYFGVNFMLFTCLNGMSAMIRKSHVETLGGLKHFAQFVAEDSELGVAFDNHGFKTQLCCHAGLQNLAETTFEVFIDRRVRWSRLRYNMPKIAPGGPWELVTESHFYAMICAAAMCRHLGLGHMTVPAVLAHAFIWCMFDASMFAFLDRSVGLPEAWEDKPSNNLFFDWGKVSTEPGGLKRFVYNLVRHYLLWIVREVSVLIIIGKALINVRHVEWGGRKFQLRGAKRSLSVEQKLNEKGDR